jgi:hypothetical protein
LDFVGTAVVETLGAVEAAPTISKGTTPMHSHIITSTDLDRYFTGFAQSLAHAPGAAHLAELAATAKAIPESILADLTAKAARLDHAIVASVLAVRAREIAVDALRYDDATDFARALDAELQVYIDEPEVTAAALAELERRERGSVH